MAIAHQALLSTGFSRQEYWSGLPFPLTRDLPKTGIKPGSPTSPADSLPSEPSGQKPVATGSHCLPSLVSIHACEPMLPTQIWSHLRGTGKITPPPLQRGPHQRSLPDCDHVPGRETLPGPESGLLSNIQK
ncbi:unnamed protein product [Rangifer tarandus platyrhynchus]|uniref:Uncharacterized protein n=1 Tax=Rangifer tarandus platyrhynchus TaxID=3082113 RepID=A0AC59ZJ34_RANTA